MKVPVGITIIIMLFVTGMASLPYINEIAFQSVVANYVEEARQSIYTDDFSAKLRVATFYMEKRGRVTGTCAPAYEELRQIFYESGKLTPNTPIQDFENLRAKLEVWQLPPMFCGE